MSLLLICFRKWLLQRRGRIILSNFILITEKVSSYDNIWYPFSSFHFVGANPPLAWEQEWLFKQQ